MKQSILYIYCILIIFCSCQQESKITVVADKIYINLPDVGEGTLKVLSPDSIFDSVTYIPLETTDDNLMVNAEKIIIHDSIMYILDSEANNILVFNMQGKYLNKLEKRGEGGDDYYMYITDFTIENQNIYVLCPANKAIIRYDLNFNFIERIHLDGNYSNFLLTFDYIYLFSDFQSDNFKNMHVMQRHNRKTHAMYADFPQQQRGVGHHGCYLASDLTDNYAFYPYQYDAYRLFPDREEIKFQLVFDKDKIFSPELQKSSSDERRAFCLKQSEGRWPIPGINNFFTTNKYYVFSFVYMDLLHLLLYNKKTHQTQMGVTFATDKYPVVINLDYMPYQGDYVIQTASADGAQRIVKGLNKDNPIYNTMKKVKTDDNPIIVIYHLK